MTVTVRYTGQVSAMVIPGEVTDVQGGKCPTLSTIIHDGIQLIMNIFRLSDVICAYTSGHRIHYTFLLQPPHILDNF